MAKSPKEVHNIGKIIVMPIFFSEDFYLLALVLGLEEIEVGVQRTNFNVLPKRSEGEMQFCILPRTEPQTLQIIY